MMEILGTKVSSFFMDGDYGNKERIRRLYIEASTPIVIQGIHYYGRIDIHYVIEDDKSVSVFESYVDLDSWTPYTGKPVTNGGKTRNDCEYHNMTDYAYDLVKNGGDLNRIAQDGIRYVKSWITRQENAAKILAEKYLTEAVNNAPENIREHVKSIAGL